MKDGRSLSTWSGRQLRSRPSLLVTEVHVPHSWTTSELFYAADDGVRMEIGSRSNARQRALGKATVGFRIYFSSIDQIKLRDLKCGVAISVPQVSSRNQSCSA